MKKKPILISILLISTILCYSQPQLPFNAYSVNPVLEHGDPGSWDEGNIIWSFMFTEDNTYYLYYSSSNDIWNEPCSIGLAISTDGYEFEKVDDPIFEPDGTGFDAYSVSFSVVIKYNGDYLLYYSGQPNPGSALGTYIGRAIADNPEGPWVPLNDPILELGSTGEWDSQTITPESVIVTDTGLLMFYSGNLGNTPSQVGMAISTDGINWTKYDDPQTIQIPYSESDPVLKIGLPGSWDDENAALCNVYKIATGLEMFYTGSHFDNWKIGYATSINGIDWVKHPDNPIYSYEDDPFAMSHGYHVAANPTIMIKDGTYFMYYDYGLMGPGYFSLAQSDALKQTIQVPGDQPTIQAAIDVATHGDTILVAEGTYYENINFLGKAITVASEFLIDGDETHIENTIIDGSQPSNPYVASVVTFDSGEDTTSIIIGFTITGGAGTAVPSFQLLVGGGISCVNSGAKILNNIIEYNHLNASNNGNGAGISQGPPEIENAIVIRDNIIQNNSITAELEAFGGGLSTSGNAIVENNIITSNNCHSNNDRSGAGGIASGGAEMRFIKMTNNIISYNSASSTTTQMEAVVCGGAWIFQCYGNVKNNIFEGNITNTSQSSWGPGVHIGFCNTNLNFEKNKVIDNKTQTGTGMGGGLCIWQGTANLNYNLISGNTATYGAGIYISNANPEAITFNHNTIVHDTAATSGGGIYIDNGNIDINNTILWNNVALYAQQFLQIAGSAEITFSDIEGGFMGIGNIDADPLFADPANGDYHLTATSPCIDAGDPTCAKDPDLTRCDMGLYYFDHVTLFNVPDDVATIQEGINIATHGDTILVDEDTYYENINFLGKAITVASHFLMDGEESHVENTIIDGSQPANPDSASVVYFTSGEDSTSIICGFSIQNGTGTYQTDLDARIGGGIMCYNSGAKIIHNKIQENQLDHDNRVFGGGIEAYDETASRVVIIRSNTITNNSLTSTNNYPGGGVGGGVDTWGIKCIVEDNQILSNTITGRPYGAGISITYCMGSIRNNLISGNTAILTIGSGRGAGLYLENNLSGTEVTGNTITNNEFNYNSGSAYGGGGIGLLNVDNVYYNEVLIDGNIIKNNFAQYGGGIFVRRAYGSIISNNIIQSNDVDLVGGGILYTYSSKSMVNDGRGLKSTINADLKSTTGKEVMPILKNNTITDNSSYSNGGGLANVMGSDFIAFNNIFYNNISSAQGNELYLYGNSNAFLYNNNLDIYEIEGYGDWEGDGNIFVDPEFDGDGYHLLPVSQCIEAGTLSLEVNGEIYNCPDYDIDGQMRPQNATADIGADEVLITGLTGATIKENNAILYNSPNPFSEITTISFELKSDCYAELSVYDLTGKKIQTILSNQLKEGLYENDFNASKHSEGIYFYQLKVDNVVMASNKMIVIK